jgi:hypothetical protein
VSNTAGALLAAVFVALVAAVVVGFFVAYDQTAAAGRVTWFMTKAQVLIAYGDPAEVQLSGFGTFQREVWIYRDPFREVQFNEYGRVSDWSPKT